MEGQYPGIEEYYRKGGDPFRRTRADGRKPSLRTPRYGFKQNGPLSAFDLASVEKLHIQRVLNHTKGNKTEAARLLNIGLTTLYRKLEEYRISYEAQS